MSNRGRRGTETKKEPRQGNPKTRRQVIDLKRGGRRAGKQKGKKKPEKREMKKRDGL